MIERADAELSLSEQAELLSVSRSSLYYTKRPPDAREVAIKHRIDALYTEHPFYGARRMSHTLGTEGLVVDRKTVGAGYPLAGDAPSKATYEDSSVDRQRAASPRLQPGGTDTFACVLSESRMGTD